MKKILISASVFLIFVLLLGIISLNLNYLLNRQDIKNFLNSAMKGALGIELNYEKISANAYNLHFNFKNLTIVAGNFNLKSERALLDFSWRKLLKLQFYPKKIQLDNFAITYRPHFPEEEEEEKILPEEKLRELAKKFSPMQVVLRNGTLDYELNSHKKLQLYFASLLANNDKDQFLLEGNLRASCFAEGKIKLRYLVMNNFLESSLKIKSLDLAKIPFDTFQTLFRATKIDLDLEIVLEKDILNLGLTGKTSLIALNRGGQLSEGAFRGYFVGNRERFELQIEPLHFLYPQLNGSLNLKKEADSGLKFFIIIEAFRFSEIKEILFSQLKTEHAQKLSEIIKDGEFSNFTMIARGASFSELFSPDNLEIKTGLSKGRLHLSEKNLNLTEISGDLSFQEKKIFFNGTCKVNENIDLRSLYLKLDLAQKERKQLFFEGDFLGEAEFLKTHAINAVENLSFLKDWQVNGNIKGSLRLEGSFNVLEPTVKIELAGLKIKTPFQDDWALFEGGILSFANGRLNLSDIKLKYKDSRTGKLGATLYFENWWLNTTGSDITLGKKTIEEFSKKFSDLEESLQRFKVDLSHVTLDEIEFSGQVVSIKQEILNLIKNLKARGKLYDFSFSMRLREEALPFQSPEIPFQISDGQIILKDFALKSIDSNFFLTGIIEPFAKSLELKGKGTLQGETVRLLQDIYGISRSVFAVKPQEFLVPSINLQISERRPLSLQTQVLKDNLILDLFLTTEEDLKLNGKLKADKSNFEISIDRISPLDLKYKGELEFAEVASLFERPLFERGLLSGNLSLVVFPQEFSSLISKFKTENKVRIIEALVEKDILRAEGHLTFNNLMTRNLPYLRNLLTLRGRANLSTNSVNFENLHLQYGDAYLLGSLEIQKGLQRGRLNGSLEIGGINLKNQALQTGNASYSLYPLMDRLFGLPLDINLNLDIKNLVLISGHQINRLKGNFTLIGSELLRVESEEINFCNLRFYAEFEKNRDFMYFFIDLPEKRGEFLDLFACLYPDEMPRTIFEGPYRIQGFFYTDGKKSLFENTYGQLEIFSDKGYLYRAPLIARVLAFLSPIDLFRGKIPNLETNVLPYEEFTIRGEFFNSKIMIDTIFFSAPGFRLFGNGPVDILRREVDLTFLVSPFRTFDVIIEHIPLLNRWLLGKERMLIYLPLQVTGKYEQPSIIPLHPASIGRGLFRFIFKFFGITEDFFRTPVNIEGFRKNELFKRRSGNTLFR